MMGQKSKTILTRIHELKIFHRLSNIQDKKKQESATRNERIISEHISSNHITTD